MITFFSSADTAWTLGAPWMLSVSMEYKNNRYLLPNMTGVFACDDERRVRSGSGVQSQPHRHPAHVAAQLLQAAATFLRLLGGLHRLRLPQLRLPRDVCRNRCYLVVRSARRVMVLVLRRNSRVQCLCLYVRNQLNPKCSRSPCSPGWWCAVQSVDAHRSMSSGYQVDWLEGCTCTCKAVRYLSTELKKMF